MRRRAFGEILDGGDAPEALVAGFSDRAQNEGRVRRGTGGAARAMRSRARALELNGDDLLDTAAPAATAPGTFNISTGAALVAAAAGVAVAKHGNRAISGTVGAADVLERFWVRMIDRGSRSAARCVARGRNLLYLRAGLSSRDGAAGSAAPHTRDPHIVQPAGADWQSCACRRAQLIGVAGMQAAASRWREAIAALGADHAMVVQGRDGLDEISLCAPTEGCRGSRGPRHSRVRNRARGIRHLRAPA